MEECKPHPGDTIIDLGCGFGRGGKELEKKELKVSYLDLIKVNQDNFTRKAGMH